MGICGMDPEEGGYHAVMTWVIIVPAEKKKKKDMHKSESPSTRFKRCLDSVARNKRGSYGNSGRDWILVTLDRVDEETVRPFLSKLYPVPLRT